MKKGYVGYSKNIDVRELSTSGGICQQISKFIISQGGIVTGVYFNDDFKLLRGFVSTYKELEKITKSKYVQAFSGDSYKIIRSFLESGKIVLFAGTPCEVAGIRTYLGKEYPNFYCIDFVCLGIPSQKAWDVYRKEIEGCSRLQEVDFKDKRNGWRGFTFYARMSDGREIAEPGRENTYMRVMISKMDCRPSCYRCRFRKLERQSDITVADAWGTESFAADLLDDRGTSSVMVNTEKGQQLIEAIKDDCVMKEFPVEQLWTKNSSAFKEYDKPDARDDFYPDMEKYGFTGAVKKADRKRKIQKAIKKVMLWRL